MNHRRFPAEWEPHGATWIAWPHEDKDWPDKLEAVQWAFAEIVRLLHRSERVEIICQDDAVAERARDRLNKAGVPGRGYRFHLAPTDRCWLRDAGPTFVWNSDDTAMLIDWRFNGWARFDDHEDDNRVPQLVEQVTSLPRLEALRPDNGERLVLEGGAIDTNGRGMLLTTEQCLLSRVQQRNPGLSREHYEAAFREYLGVTNVIWLGEGCVGDDTHGHVDDIARFVAPDTVALAVEHDPLGENYHASQDNLARLRAAADQDGDPLRIVELPFPRTVSFDGEPLPPSYANFYIGNTVVLVPTFNDVNDRVALQTLAELFPERTVTGLHCLDLILGGGSVHCLTQQQIE